MADEKEPKMEKQQFDDLFEELTSQELEVAMVNASARMEMGALLENKSLDYIQGFTDGLQFECSRQKRLSQIFEKQGEN